MTTRRAKAQTGVEGTYFVITISGHTNQLPLRIQRKKAAPRRQIKDATRTGFAVHSIGDGPYFGFELSGDGRFLLGDFTVTHNTTLLNRWIAGFEERCERWRVAVTASTGIAATHLGGQTIHSWCGIGIGDSPLDKIVTSRWWLQKCKHRIEAVSALVVDEVSLLDGKTLDLIDMVCCAARNNFDEPFGGLQIVLVGDLAQLPPVQVEERGFCFDSEAWQNSMLWSVRLTEVHRQSDAEFSAALEEIRLGGMSDKTLALLGKRVRAFDPVEAGAVRLMTHNVQVDEVNHRHLEALKEPARSYVAHDFGIDPKEMERLDKNCLSPKDLQLKRGARVMATKNDQDQRWANGSLGTVTYCGDDYVAVVFDSGQRHEIVTRATWTTEEGGTQRVLASRDQIPLRLAWAMTIHKSQGSTLEKVSMDLSQVFADGQAYVALSRARTLEGLNIEAWRGRHSIRANPRVLAEIRKQE
jgi:ATP-dependent exoDNAse (exonuclease V) alpha subunit